jgi:hypothetical protein
MKKLAILAAAAAALAALLSVGQHVLVSGPRLKKLVNAKPEELLVEYDSATAWVPGTLRFTNLRVRGRDANVEWEVRLPAARLDYAPFALLSRTFRMRRLSGGPLEFRLRERQHPDRVSRNASLFPEIEGFSDPPLKDPNAPEHPPRTSPPWKIRLDSIDAPTRLLWIGPWRYEGEARVTGEFTLQPGWHAEIGPAAVEFTRVELSLGKDVVLADAHGAARCRIAPFDVRQVKGSQVWPYIGGEFSLAGRVVALDFFRRIYDERSAPALRQGKGQASVEIRIERGIGRGGASIEAAGVVAKTSGGALRGDLTARAEIPRWELETGEIDVGGSRIDLRRVTASTSGGAEVEWWGKFRLPRGRIAGGRFDAQLEATCRDARPLYSLFSVRLPEWTQKLLELRDLSASARMRLSSALTAFDGLSITGGDYRISGEYADVRGRKHAVFLLEKGKLAVAVQIDEGRHSLRPLGAREWYQAAAEEHRREWGGKWPAAK